MQLIEEVTGAKRFTATKIQQILLILALSFPDDESAVVFQWDEPCTNHRNYSTHIYCSIFDLDTFMKLRHI